MAVKIEPISSKFIWRRIHSLMGLFIVFYLIIHLVVNSQAAVWLGENGEGFVRLVNLLESLPFLHVIEITLIGLPIAVHMAWGIIRALTAKTNSSKTDGSSASLKYGRNISFSFQRYTAWILVFGIIGHVAHMRFLERPKYENGQFVIEVSSDSSLEILSKKLDFQLVEKDSKLLAQSKEPGKAILLMVREIFKSPIWAVLYSIFVIVASFHAFNGVWTALITWGFLLSYRSQKAFIPICWMGVALMMFLGLMAIWGTYLV
jgi:succinate dehydrogenase / fumarate reductase cytochrome b subunit